MLSDTRIDGYCLVSSDSDFAPLALRLRESGRFVVGIGARQTRAAMLNACDGFAFIPPVRRVIGLSLRQGATRVRGRCHGRFDLDGAEASGWRGLGGADRDTRQWRYRRLDQGGNRRIVG